MENLDAENKASQDDDSDPVARATLAASQAKTLDELRRSLTVTLTLKHKLSVQEVAEVIGRSPSWVYAARQPYLSGKQVANRNTHGGRRNQIFSLEEEDAFMDEACREYRRLEWVIWLHHYRRVASTYPQDHIIHRRANVPKAISFFENLYDDYRVTREDVELRLVVRRGLEKKAGRPISNSTVFALMARVGKRKFGKRVNNYALASVAEV